MAEVFEHIRTKAAMRSKDDSTTPNWIDPKAATFYVSNKKNLKTNEDEISPLK